MSRAARAVISHRALQHNLDCVRRAAPGSRVLAVIKANAYGHGIVRVARALANADAFAVASIDEAMVLREAGVKQPIVLLEGVFEMQELQLAVEHGLQLVVHSEEQLRLLESSQLPQAADIWLKIDTGMHRLGFSPDVAYAVWRRLKACDAVAETIRLMTHFANSDQRDDPTTDLQLDRFEAALTHCPGERSAANSGAVLAWPRAHMDWVRPGIMLYGASPFCDAGAAEFDLRPAMSLHSRLIAVQRYRRGEPIGYGGTWRCPEDMSVGVAAIGYGDGYPRHAPPGTPVLLNNKSVPLIGRVSMDMICLDLRTQPGAAPGDAVMLWGDGLPVEDIAASAGTIAYELLCRVTARVPMEDKFD